VEERTSSHRSYWWAFAGGGATLAAAVAGRTQIDPWLFGALLLSAWGLLAHAVRLVPVTNLLRLLLIATSLALAVVAWSYTAPQPRMRLDGVQLQSLPSTVRPGAVELIVRNSGTVSADVVASTVAYLAPAFFRTAQALAAGSMEADLSRRLQQADPAPPTVTMVVPPGETARIEVLVPASERAWYIARGEATVVIAARFRYRDRLFVRERVFCHFANPPSGQWLSCPFLND
jgi:hypothetical protein